MFSSNDETTISRALKLFNDQPIGIRAFVRCRHFLCPLAEIERQVPTEGAILDLGCGHGLFSALMATASAGRSITGVDPSVAKISAANRLVGKLPNVRFFHGTIDDVRGREFDAITIVDVLYLLPVYEKLKVLKRCHELLTPNGRLILKTNDTHPAWKYRWARLQEIAMTGLGLTLSHGALHFIACTEHVGLLRQAGFRDIRVTHLPTLLPYPHTLFVGSK